MALSIQIAERKDVYNRVRTALSVAAGRDFALVAVAAFVLDATAFIGTRLVVERSGWSLAFLGVTTVLWALCVPLMADRRNILPLVIGAVGGGAAAIYWP